MSSLDGSAPRKGRSAALRDRATRRLTNMQAMSTTTNGGFSAASQRTSANSEFEHSRHLERRRFSCVLAEFEGLVREHFGYRDDAEVVSRLRRVSLWLRNAGSTCSRRRPHR